MSALEEHVTKYMITTDTSSAEALDAIQQLASTVNQGSVQDHLLQLIQSLGEYLTSDDDFIRAKATGLLSNCLIECQQGAINESAVSVLVDFYCDRLSDKTCVQNLLNGLVALTAYDHFTSTNAVSVIKRIMERVEVQSYSQSTRSAVYQVIDQLIERYASALRSINNEFVFGFTQILDGEKDPRNLMLAFKIVKNIVDQFDISTHVEDLFEVTFCYFPITFKPPPDDPYGITADDLKVGLRRCVASTPHFAKFAVPLILEKLSSTSGSAKKDSMETLAACAPVYGSSSLLPHMHEIFSSLKIEVYHATDSTLEDAAVEAIRCVVSALSTGISNGSEEEPTEQALRPLIEECVGTLKDPDMKDAKQTGRILRAAASASDPACQCIVDTIVPLVLKQMRETNTATLKKANMDILIDLLEAGKTLYGAADEHEKVDQDFISPLIQHKERFFGIFESSLMASNEYNLLRLSGLDGIKLMVLSKNYLEPNEVGLAVQSFNKILMNEVEDMDLRKAALNALYVTAHVYSLYIVEETLPALMDKLPENSDVRKDSYALTALRVLCPIASVYTHGMPLLLQKLDAICQQGQRVDDAQEIASVILNILQAKENDHEQLVQEIHTMVPYIFRKTIEASLNTAQPSLYLDTNLLQTLSLVIITIFTKVDSSSQKGFVDALFKSFIQSDLSDLLHVEGQFKPLNPSSPEAQQKTVCLFAAIICSLRKDVVLPISSMEDYLNEMVTLALSSPIQVTSVSRMIGSLINKWKDDAALTEYVKTTTLLLQDTVTQNPYALEVYLWITKSLVLRAHPLGYALTDQLIAWCGDNSMQGVPQGFDILIGDDPFALNKPMFTTVTILYKQRFFSYSLPKLIQGYENAQEEIKSNYLIALSFVLKNVPKQILLNELPPLVPLLIQSLGLSDTSLKVSTLSTFRLAVTEAPQVISNQVNAILPSLLNILQDPSNPIQVRVAVLGCLSEFPVFLSKEIVKPHSLLVLSKLKIPLDDRKRIVRKEAVDCRSKWFAIL